MSYFEPPLVFDTSMSANFGTTTHPKFRTERRDFKQGIQIKITTIFPNSNVYNVTSTNKTITIDATPYTIAEGTYASLTDIADAYSITGYTITVSNITGKFTITNDATTNFDLAVNDFLGFTSAKTGAFTYVSRCANFSAVYTANKPCNISPRAIMFCSNLAQLFQNRSISHRREKYNPPDLFDAVVVESVGRDVACKTEWLTVSQEQELDYLEFFWRYPNSITSDVPIYSDWNIIVSFRY